MPYRWIALVVFISAISISGRFRWRARKAAGVIPRGSEPPGLIAMRLVGALPLFGSVLAWMIRPSWMAWAAVPLPTALRILGAVLGLATPPSVWWVLSHLGSNVSETVLTKPEQRLVTTGPYRHVRHPLYSTGIALFLSMGVMSSNAFILLWTVIVTAGIRLIVIPREDAALARAFGEMHKRYESSTGALIPRLFRAGG